MKPEHNHESLDHTFKITKDVMEALKRDFPGGVTASHARFLVDAYYSAQSSRIAIGNYETALERDAKKTGNPAEPHDYITALTDSHRTAEDNIKRLLAWYVISHDMYWFFENTPGIGTILAAGLLAHIDITKCPTVGAIWRFAGLDPTQTFLGKEKAKALWEKQTQGDLETRLAQAAHLTNRKVADLRRLATRKPDGSEAKLTADRIVKALSKPPHNAALKTLCFKIGDSFIKLSGRKELLYSRLYSDYKAELWRKNLAGDLQDTAAHYMSVKNYGKTTEAYPWYTGQYDPAKVAAWLADKETVSLADCKAESGQGQRMLAPGHINDRARRYVVKLFLSHLHECWYHQHYGKAPPAPFAIAIQGHAHYIPPPQLAAYAATEQAEAA